MGSGECQINGTDREGAVRGCAGVIGPDCVSNGAKYSAGVSAKKDSKCGTEFQWCQMCVEGFQLCVETKAPIRTEVGNVEWCSVSIVGLTLVWN